MSRSRSSSPEAKDRPKPTADWLSHHPDSSLPIDKERVARLRTYVHGTGGSDRDTTQHVRADDATASSPKAQVVYGTDTRLGLIDWKREPLYPDNPWGNILDPDAPYVVRKVSRGGPGSPWELHSIIVQSPHIMGILRTALADYPGVSPAVDNLTLDAPFKPIFHRWADLRRAVSEADPVARQHTDGLISLWKEELAVYFQALHDADTHGIIEHSHLWIIFIPGEPVWWDMKQHHSVGKIVRTAVDGFTGDFKVLYKQTAWDGFALRAEAQSLDVPAFAGTESIKDLNAVPLSRKPDTDDIRATVLERGKKFMGLLGCHYREYMGWGLTRHPRPHEDEENQWEAVHGRVVLDAALWNGKIRDRPDPKRVASLSSSISESDLLTCSALIKGYSLSAKQWYKLFIDNVSNVVWDSSFSSLVIGEVEKELLLGFAHTKLTQRTDFDDVIRGKGQGVIILLSGPPGVGKTLTVESIANAMRVPLYPLSAGELGIQAETVERRLAQALTFCKEWDAVLLLDEADIFLESRSASNLERNELVSIFLRLLEYYQGMMFLTTNRIESMDTAFQSRIDLTLSYPELSSSSRAIVWKNLIGNDNKIVTEADLDELASHVLNGRQIKNVVKLAKLLAVRRDEHLRMDHLRRILELSTKHQTSEGG